MINNEPKNLVAHPYHLLYYKTKMRELRDKLNQGEAKNMNQQKEKMTKFKITKKKKGHG